MQSPQQYSLPKQVFRALTMVLALVNLSAAPSAAQISKSPPMIGGLIQLAALPPVMPCAELAGTDLSKRSGVAATITSAEEVTAGNPYCRVTGTIARAIHFEVRMPSKGWTQRYLQTGCGGLCGTLRIDAGKADDCEPVTDGSIVLASDDMGHQGNDNAWGENSDQRIDFAYRGNHVTALAAKALTVAYYGRAPRYSYFSGCSDGGREALIEAQRYPNDFDGIAAGAPALNFTVQNSFHHGWLAKVNSGPDGKPLLSAVDMQPLHAAVLKACDGLDGLVDGQITDPRSCHFDPVNIKCQGSYSAGECLTAAQVVAVQAIYDGARSPSGKALEVGPLMRGSELQWIGVFIPRETTGRIGSEMMALGTINHLLFTPNPDYTIASFPFTDAMFAREEAARKLYNADDPNLSRFAANGGKLILWHGWSDPHISPLNTIDYFEKVGRRLGANQRDHFVRMFMLPGMGHCSGGDGPNDFPLLYNLMAWVEQGSAPNVMVARRAVPNGFGLPVAGNGPKPAGQADQGGPPPEILQEIQRKQVEEAALGSRSRPVFAYPLVARYSGSGPVDSAASFVAESPSPANGVAHWIGNPH